MGDAPSKLTRRQERLIKAMGLGLVVGFAFVVVAVASFVSGSTTFGSIFAGIAVASVAVVPLVSRGLRRSGAPFERVRWYGPWWPR